MAFAYFALLPLLLYMYFTMSPMNLISWELFGVNPMPICLFVTFLVQTARVRAREYMVEFFGPALHEITSAVH